VNVNEKGKKKVFVFCFNVTKSYALVCDSKLIKLA